MVIESIILIVGPTLEPPKRHHLGVLEGKRLGSFMHALINFFQNSFISMAVWLCVCL